VLLVEGVELVRTHLFKLLLAVHLLQTA